jgi:hypothetical protein
MHLRFTFAVVLSLFCAQATLTASTSYNPGTPTIVPGSGSPITGAVGGATFDSGGANPTYTSGMWTEDFTGTNTTTGEQIVCTVGVGLTVAEQAQTCGNPGPGSAANIGVNDNVNSSNVVTGQPTGTLPTGTTDYIEDDGDPTYGAPVSVTMNLTPGQSYQLSFYQASNEEDGNDKAYSDSWQVYMITGASPAGEYICPTGICTTAVDPGGIQPVFTSTAMVNTGNEETPWQLQTYTFVATQATEILEFVTDAVGTAGFQPPLLDLAAVTTTQLTGAPEPGTWVLTVLGIGLVFGAGKLRRRSTSASFKRVQNG